MINRLRQSWSDVRQLSLRRRRRWWVRIGLALLALPLLMLIQTGAQGGNYRQPAYISNAYFSDKMAEQGDSIQPMAVVKALRTRPSGVVGYFILDLILAHKGTHHFKVNIINQEGEKITDLVYAPVESPKSEILPLYTAAGAISGEFTPGLWFFKVYDRVDNGNWQPLGAFSIMLLDPGRMRPLTQTGEVPGTAANRAPPETPPQTSTVQARPDAATPSRATVAPVARPSGKTRQTAVGNKARRPVRTRRPATAAEPPVRADEPPLTAKTVPKPEIAQPPAAPPMEKTAPEPVAPRFSIVPRTAN